MTEEIANLEKQLNDLVSSKDFSAEAPELFVANYIAEIERMVINQQEATGDYDFTITAITPGAMTSTQVETGGDNKDELDEEGGGLQGFPTRDFQMQMTGRYATLVDFLYQLADLKLDRLVTIKRLSLAPKSKGLAGSPVLSVQIPITAYLRQGGG